MEGDTDVDAGPKIDVEKSILKQQLVYKKNWEYYFNTILAYPFLIIIVGGPILLAIRGTDLNPWFMLVCLLIDIWLISCFILRDIFIKIDGKSTAENKKNMFEALDDCYDDLEFQVNNDKVLRSYLPSGRPVWGRDITVIFDESLILLNITKLGKTNNPTFVHGPGSYLRSNKIAKYFKEKYLAS